VTSLGTLVDEGKLEWDKPVREYLPGFRMYAPAATEQLTTRDMVTHRTGLRHDLAWYSSSFTREQLVEWLRYLEPNKPIRSTFQYNNLMFMTAGYLGGRIAGGTWEDLVQRRVLDPLGMTKTKFSSADARKTPDSCRIARTGRPTPSAGSNSSAGATSGRRATSTPAWTTWRSTSSCTSTREP
jgi:CubicO group peptidase (beta-lactamase class C family)